ANQRRGLFVVFKQTRFKAVLIVVGPAAQVMRTADVANTLDLGRLGLIVIDLTAIAASIAAGDARNQRLIIDAHFDHGIDLLPHARHKRAQSISLRQSAREAIKDETRSIRGL